MKPQRIDNMQNSIGRQPYQIKQEIGRGGMGIVYRARQEGMDRDVALKVLPDFSSKNSRERFIREVKALAKVQHPNLVRVYSCDFSDRELSFAMELVEGEDLASCIRRLREQQVVHELLDGSNIGSEGYTAPHPDTTIAIEPCAETVSSGGENGRATNDPRPTCHKIQQSQPRISQNYFRQCSELCRDMSQALHALHSNGIVHRDVKPSNIMVRHDGPPVLMDLGVAKVTDTNASLTLSQQFVGTVLYASPEQIRSADNVDLRTDIYSLGATLWALLALKPFLRVENNATLLEIMHRVLSEEPVPLRCVNPNIPRELEAIVSKCLEKDPAMRYSSAEALADDLQNFLSGNAVGASHASTLRRFAKWLKRDAIRVSFCFVVLGLLVNNGVKFVLKPLFGSQFATTNEIEQQAGSVSWALIGLGVLLWAITYGERFVKQTKAGRISTGLSLPMRVFAILALVSIALISLKTQWSLIAGWMKMLSGEPVSVWD